MPDILTETLFRGDLKNTMRNVISIDDFESVIDGESVVLAFYFKNKDAAEDSSIFLERSHITKILDTEISTGTNKDGDTLLFVEIDNSSKDAKQFVTLINDICQLMSNLSTLQTWNIKNIDNFGNKLYKKSDKLLMSLYEKL